MKVLVSILLFSLVSKTGSVETLNYGVHTLQGKIILKTLKNPANGKSIKNAVVLQLTKTYHFKATSEDEQDATTNEVHLYGNLDKNENPNIIYKDIIGKKVSVTADFGSRPSGLYPMPVNIITTIKYTVIK